MMSFATRSMRLASRQSLRPFVLQPTTVRQFHRSRFLKDQASSASNGSKSSSSGIGNSASLVGGAIGGSTVLVLGYLWYTFSGAKAGVKTISDAKGYLDSAKEQFKNKGEQLKPDETLQWLRSTTVAYAGLIPGGKGMMDKVFDGLEDVRRDHEGELSEIVNEAYSELKQLANKGSLDAETATKAWNALEKAAKKLEKLVESAGSDILDKNPELKEKYGKKLKQLKDMGEKQGGEAKKLADDTYQKVRDAVSKGDLSKIGDLVQENLQKAQSMGDESLNKAFEKMKPYLEKAPEVKKKIEENFDKLKEQNLGGLIKTLQDAAQSGDVNALKDWVEKQTQQVQGMGDQAWKGAMIRASIYLDKYPDLKKIVESKGDALKKIDFDEFMNQLRKTGETGDTQPVKDFIERETEKLKNA